MVQDLQKTNKFSVSFELKETVICSSSDLVRWFFEDMTKLKVPLEIKPSLRMNKPMVESRNVI